MAVISARLNAESTHKGVNQCLKYVTQVQQQRPESSTVTLTWHACKYKVHKLQHRYILKFRLMSVLLPWYRRQEVLAFLLYLNKVNVGFTSMVPKRGSDPPTLLKLG